jgi:hypothetical protein
MRRIPTLAAGLLLGVVAFAATGCSQAPIAHSCAATDKQFLNVAEMNMASLGYWSNDFVHGDASAADVLTETTAARTRVKSTSPQDPTLQQTRKLLDGMLREYSRAVVAQSHHHDAGAYMMRAYGLANFAHDILAQAQPGLKSRGCDVSSLL